MTPIDSVGDPMPVILSDSSKAAYGAAAYVVWTFLDTSNEARLVLAKSRLALKKQSSIVSSEMCEVLFAVRHKQITMTRENVFYSKKKLKLCDLPEVATSKLLFIGTSSSTVIVDFDVTKFSSLSALRSTVARILPLKDEKVFHLRLVPQMSKISGRMGADF